MQLSDSTKDILRQAILLGILLSLMTLVPLLIALGKSEVLRDEIFTQIIIYNILGVPSLLIIFIFSSISIIEAKQDATYGDSVGFNSIGQFPSPKLPFIKNSLGAFFLFVCIFAIFGLAKLSFGSNVAFTGVPFLQQQFTPLDNLIFSNTLVPISENAGAGALFAFYVFMLRYWARKYKWSKTNFVVMFFLGAIIIFIAYTFILHQIRYGDSDVSLESSMILWGTGGFMNALVNSFIPFWVAHSMNNLILDLIIFFNSDLAYFVSVFLIVSSGFLYWFFTFKKKAQIPKEIV